MSLTSAVAPNGRQPLSSLEIWRDGANAAVGLPDRSVELVYYDEQSTQFQDGSKQPILWPDKHNTETMIYPYSSDEKR